MTGQIILHIDQATPLLNEWQRMHWSKRRLLCKQWAWLIGIAYHKTGAKLSAPLDRCEIHVRRGSPGLPDWDGIYGGLKPALDCLVAKTKRNPHGLGIILDDNPRCVLKLTAEPVPGIEKPGFTKIIITPMEL